MHEAVQRPAIGIERGIERGKDLAQHAFVARLVGPVHPVGYEVSELHRLLATLSTYSGTSA